jgi:hypothetical protein
LAERLHRLGVRAAHELIVELVAEFGPGVIDRLERYARLDPDAVHALGADRFPPRLFAARGG